MDSVPSSAASTAITVEEARDAAAIQAAWRVLDASGYLDLTAPEQRAENRARFFARYTHHHEPRPAHRVLLARMAGRVVATITIGRLLGTTWTVQHFAVDPSVRGESDIKRAVCSTLYGRAVAELGGRSDCFDVVVYCDARKAFNRFVYGQFAARLGQRHRCSQRGLVVRKALAAEPEAAHDIGCRVASPDQAEAVRARTTADMPVAEARALGFLGPTAPARTVLLPDADAPTAALILDAGEPGVNLFSLSSPCRLVPLAARMRPDHVVALVRGASAFLHDHGFGEFTVFAGPKDAIADDVATPAGLSAQIPGFCFVAHRDALADWQRHIESGLLSSRTGVAS